jgi:type IX secretion system substrate protein
VGSTPMVASVKFLQTRLINFKFITVLRVKYRTMKIVLLFLTCFLSDTVLYAQPILTHANTSPAGGEVFVRHSCGVSHFSMGDAGPGVTWNFEGLSTIATDTVSYIACGASGICDSFPGATVAFFNGSTYEFYASDTNEFAKSGAGIAGGNIYYSHPEARIFYPTVYNASTKDSFAHSRPAFLWFGYGVDSFIADGYGALILPSRAYSDVLRLHTISINADSNFGGGVAVVDSYRYDIYSWYTPGFRNPLLSMYYDFTGLTGTPELAQIYYYSQEPPAGVQLIPGNEGITDIYPNPATDQLNIRLDAVDGHLITLDLLDILGHVVLVGTNKDLVPGINKIVLDLPELTSGLYLLRIQLPGGCVIRKVQIIK